MSQPYENNKDADQASMILQSALPLHCSFACLKSESHSQKDAALFSRNFLQIQIIAPIN